MRKVLLFSFILISGCNGINHGHIGETEKEYRNKNRIREQSFAYDTNSVIRHVYTNPRSDGKYITYIFKNGDSTMVGYLKNGREVLVNAYKKGHKKLTVDYDSKKDTSYSFGKFTDDDEVPSQYMLKKGDTTKYYNCLDKNEIDWISYTFVKGVCIKIDTNFLRGEVRNL